MRKGTYLIPLHNYFELCQERIPEQSLRLTLKLEKRVQPATKQFIIQKSFI